MITELVLKVFFGFANFLIGLLPKMNGEQGSITSVFYDLLQYGIYFFGSSPFAMVFASVVLWASVDILWAIIEWVYIKIPGVN
mgnify:FL=1